MVFLIQNTQNRDSAAIQVARKDLRAGKSDTDVREVGDSHRKESNAKRRRKATK